MACRICTELERSLHNAREPDAPHLLLGLTPVGLRNRENQHKEKIIKAELVLSRHQKTCTAVESPQ
jgi:hypothetical protein